MSHRLWDGTSPQARWKAGKRAQTMLKALGRDSQPRLRKSQERQADGGVSDTPSPYDPDLNSHRVLFPSMKDKW